MTMKRLSQVEQSSSNIPEQSCKSASETIIWVELSCISLDISGGSAAALRWKDVTCIADVVLLHSVIT